MIGVDLRASTKLAVIWIVIPKVLLYSESNIGFDLSYFICFILNFVLLGFFFPLYLFNFFYPRMDKLMSILTSLAFLVSKMDLSTLLAHLVSNLKSKLYKVVMKCKTFLASGPIFSNYTSLRL